MPNILHRLTIDASPDRVHRLIATRDGIERWWTRQPVTGEEGVGGRLSVRFSDAVEVAATFEIVEHGAAEIVWRCVAGPEAWIDTRIVYALVPRDEGTTLLFRHEGWRRETEFMGNCSTNWAAYLMSLRSGAEGNGFHPYPDGEISR